MLAIYNAPIALETGGKSVARIEQRADGLRAQVRPLRLALGSVLSAWHRNILQLRHEKVSMPVLAIGADHSLGAKVGQQVQQYANHVRSVVITNSGHWLPEEHPQEVVQYLTSFFDWHAPKRFLSRVSFH